MKDSERPPFISNANASSHSSEVSRVSRRPSGKCFVLMQQSWALKIENGCASFYSSCGFWVGKRLPRVKWASLTKTDVKIPSLTLPAI